MIKNTHISEKARLAVSFGLAFFLLVILYIQSNGLVEGGQDSYNHFLISKYAFKYPVKLLDQWGKPIYTILAHPFCILGLSTAVWFNLICTLIAALFTALCAKKLAISNYWITFWIVIFCPISLGNSISTLTEPLNMLLLSAAFYSWLSVKKVTATLLFSMLPWIRTEGFVIIVPFLVYLIISKHYKLIPLLFSATFLINLLGWWQTGEPFWFITSNPYVLVESESHRFSPGPGSLFYYIKNNKMIFGNIVGILSLFGACLFMFKERKRKQFGFSFWVIIGIFTAYFFAHSFIMWRGMMGTHGMLRVMMVIVPCIALFFNYFMSQMSLQFMEKKPWAAYSIILIILILSTFQSYKAVGYPTSFWNLNKASVKQLGNYNNMVKAADFIKEKGLENRVLYHQIPIYNVAYNKDPYAKPLSPGWVTEDIWSIDHKNNWAPKGSILIWDGYHAAREGNLPMDTLKSMNQYKLLTKFIVNDSAIHPNDMFVFEKIK